MVFTVPDSLFSSILCVVEDTNIKRFTTSANVVMKVSGLRFEAIRVIARTTGIEIEDPDDRCIDDNLLSLLADAHVRQFKSYFNKTKRHIAELTGDEFSMFIDFCKTFQKSQTNIALSWDNIDTDAIREQFIKKVHDFTPGSEFVDSELYNPNNYHKDLLICRLLNNRWLYIRYDKQQIFNCDRNSQLRRVTQSSRYYIFSNDDYHIACL